MGHAWRRAATIIRCDSGEQRMASSFEHYKDTAKTWPASYGVLMGDYWPVVAVEGAMGNYCSGMRAVDNFYVPWLDIRVTYSPSRGIPKETFWSVPVSTEHCAGGMSRGECACTFDKVIKHGFAP